MLFSHDTEHTLACIVDLVNSAPSTGNVEQLPDVASLARFVVEHDLSEVGELTDREGRPRDLHLKGSGRTPFSRGGDGLAVVGPMLRE